jgi:signal transduction histidine kinase
MSARAIRHLLDGLGRLRAILGAPGLMIGFFSILSFGFGLFVLAREYNFPRQTAREALHEVLSGWVRAPDYLGLTLIDYVDGWRAAPPEARTHRLATIRSTLDDLGAELARQEDRFPLVRIVGMDVTPSGGEPLARWEAAASTGGPGTRSDVEDRINLIAPGAEPAVDLIVRYRIAPTVASAARDLESSYHHLVLALLGLSGYSLLCLGYMILHAQALSKRVAREAAQEAALDLADRTCHELGNGVFVLANERRNLTNHLELIDRFVAEESEARAAAARRLELDPALAARWSHALKREYAARGIDPDLELRGSAAIAHDVCRQIAVCAEYLSLTVRELDAFLKRSALPVQPARVEVEASLDEALALLGPRLESADAQIERQIEGEGRLAVLADRRLFVHALVNLLKNAIEATSGAGIVPRITLSARVNGASVLIGIADNGPGISEENLRRVFEVGFSTKGPGRGRGLAIVRESVHVQGGEIRVLRRPEGGTEFLIELPAAKDSASGIFNTDGLTRKKP